jgi:hypothetical protein
MTGAVTLDGNSWLEGPYDVWSDGVLPAGPLPEPLDANDHLAVVYTTVAPPEAVEGCTAYPPVP